MLRSKWVLGGLIALAVLPSAATSFAGGTYVLGDSIGDGLATTMGFNNLAQIGIHIRGPKALAQIARTPPGSTAYIFLGTNDAEGSLKNIDKSIDDILDAAAQLFNERGFHATSMRDIAAGEEVIGVFMDTGKEVHVKSTSDIPITVHPQGPQNGSPWMVRSSQPKTATSRAASRNVSPIISARFERATWRRKSIMNKRSRAWM